MPTTMKIEIEEPSIEETESEYDEETGGSYIVYFCAVGYTVNGHELVAYAQGCDPGTIDLDETGITAAVERELGLSDEDVKEIQQVLTKTLTNWFRKEMREAREERWGDPVHLYGLNGFAEPGGNSALRAASETNPRNQPCPTCGAENVLTPADVARGYQCDACADMQERGF